MHNQRRRSVIGLLAFFLAMHAAAAEFDIDAGRTLLRRLQYCLDCGSALLVTHVHTGNLVRCPDCGREQPRLADQYTLTQIHQLCKLCQFPLDAGHHHAGDTVECANCHTRQTLVSDIFARGPGTAGLGYAPGFPPGSARKKLLYSLDRPAAALTVAPLPDTASQDAAQAITGQSVTPIPQPDPDLLAAARPPASRTPPSTPLPDLPPSAPGTLTPQARQSALPSGTAVTVPSVTVDMFGAPMRKAAAPVQAGSVGPGPVAALVDGVPIHIGEVDRIVSPVMQLLREQGAVSESSMAEREGQLRREILARLIDRELTTREAAAMGFRPDPAEVRARENELKRRLTADGALDLRKEAERDVVMLAMRKRFGDMDSHIGPDTVREYYRTHQQDFTRPRLLAIQELAIFQDRSGKDDRRSHRDIAAEVAQALERGERFDDLRQRFDEFAPAAGSGLTEPRLTPESALAWQIRAQAGSFRPGAVFGPLFLEGIALFGKVVDEQPSGPAPFEQVEGEIRRRLEEAAKENSFAAWLARLRQKAKIEYPAAAAPGR